MKIKKDDIQKLSGKSIIKSTLRKEFRWIATFLNPFYNYQVPYHASLYVHTVNALLVPALD